MPHARHHHLPLLQSTFYSSCTDPSSSLALKPTFSYEASYEVSFLGSASSVFITMCSRLLRKICSLFYQQPIKKYEADASRTINGVFRDWVTSAVDDVPPPYTDAIKKETLFHDKKQPQPLLSAAFTHLQICPHETLSFEGLQDIANALAISNPGATMDALTLRCHEHRSHYDPAAKNSKCVCVSSPGLLRGFGSYAFEVGKDPSHSPGVLLCFDWDLGLLNGIRAQVENAAELQRFLGADGIWLCPHKRISDSDIINAAYGFVKKPSGREVITACDQCDTEIKISTRMEGIDDSCHVTTNRYLGTVEKANGPMWRAQRGG